MVEAEQRNARPEDGEGAEDSDQHRTEAQEEEALREQPRVEPPAQQQPSDRQPERALAYGEGILSVEPCFVAKGMMPFLVRQRLTRGPSFKPAA